jgi:hypothetical protein
MHEVLLLPGLGQIAINETLQPVEAPLGGKKLNGKPTQGNLMVGRIKARKVIAPLAGNRI